MSLPSQLQNIVNDVERCIEVKLYYPAITLVLTLPDICTGLALPDDTFVTNKTYADFVDTYTQQKPDPSGDANVLGCDGAACYKLRCGVVHRGNAAGHPFFGMTHVLFSPPQSSARVHGVAVHVANAPEKAACFDIEIFCGEMIRGVHRWYRAHKDDPLVVANMTRLLSARPNGVHPFTRGVYTIASGP